MPGVYKRGNQWYYYFNAGKVNGTYKKVCRKGGSTKAEAEKALRAAIKEFEDTELLKLIIILVLVIILTTGIKTMY